MNEDLNVLVFDLSGMSEIIPEIRDEQDIREVETDEGGEPEKPRPQDIERSLESESTKIRRRENEIVELLNKSADAISSSIESEIKRILPVQMTVQAQVQFKTGNSIILEGALTLLSWGGTVLLAAAKEELESQLKRIVQSAIQRVMNRAISDKWFVRSMTQMEITAEPQKAPVKKDSSSEGDSGDPVKAAPDLFQDEALKETFFLRTEQQRFSRWVWGTIGAALLIQLVYLFTRFIDVTFTLKP